jgi:hypothetical protein
LLCAVALLLAAPSASAATGKVSGKVMSASSHVGIENVEVRFYKVENAWNREFTGAGGDYSAVLEPGEYTVEFVPEGSTYAAQYYKEKATYGVATKVTVKEGGEVVVNAALSQSNTINGIVTSNASGTELGGIDVIAYEAKPPNDKVASVDTNSFGKYELTGLTRGEYVLEFAAGIESGLNFAPQFYKESTRFGEATPISLTEGEHRENTDAKLRQGGSVSGTVTDAATRQPLEGIVVYAVSSGTAEPVSVAVSGADGSYLLPGMGSGSVVVAFLPNTKEDEALYSSQVFDDRPFPEELKELRELLVYGTPLTVTAGIETTGIDAAMVRKEPANAVAPVASGTPAVGQTLTCEHGSWTGIATLSFTQQWLRDGVAIAGATGSTYVVQAADEGHELSCEVTATNEFGKSGATSKALAVPARIEPAPASPAVVVGSSKITVSGNTAHVAIACAGANCSGTIELTEQKLVKHRKGRRTVSKKETVVLAEGSYSLAVGHSSTIVLHLTAKGRSALAAARTSIDS